MLSVRAVKDVPILMAFEATEVKLAVAEHGDSLPLMSTSVIQPYTVPPQEAEPTTVLSEQNWCVPSQAACAVNVVGAAVNEAVEGVVFQYWVTPERSSS